MIFENFRVGPPLSRRRSEKNQQGPPCRKILSTPLSPSYTLKKISWGKRGVTAPLNTTWGNYPTNVGQVYPTFLTPQKTWGKKKVGVNNPTNANVKSLRNSPHERGVIVG